MAFTKGMKKGLSVLLSLAMVVTSVSINGKTADAESVDVSLTAEKYSTAEKLSTNEVTVEGTVEDESLAVDDLTVTVVKLGDNNAETETSDIEVATPEVDGKNFSAKLTVKDTATTGDYKVKVAYVDADDDQNTGSAEAALEIVPQYTIELDKPKEGNDTLAVAVAKDDATVKVTGTVKKYDATEVTGDDIVTLSGSSQIKAANATVTDGEFEAELELSDLEEGAFLYVTATANGENGAAYSDDLYVRVKQEKGVFAVINYCNDEWWDGYWGPDKILTALWNGTAEENAATMQSYNVDVTKAGTYTITAETTTNFNQVCIIDFKDAETNSNQEEWLKAFADNITIDSVKLDDTEVDKDAECETGIFFGDDGFRLSICNLTNEEDSYCENNAAMATAQKLEVTFTVKEDFEKPADAGKDDDKNPTEAAKAATVTGITMAPNAITATAGAVTTKAAVLTVSGSALNLLAVNNVTVSAVSTSGITVALATKTAVTATAAAATFEAVVTVPTTCATGNYVLVASAGAVTASVATVSVIAEEAPVVEDVHTTKLTVKTATGTNKVTMGKGETAKIKVTKKPAASVDAVTAKSAKPKYVKASINKNGKLVLKAKKVGTAKVTLTSGTVTKKVTVTIKKAPKKLTLKAGKKAAKKTVTLNAKTKKKAVKTTYKVVLPKNTASYAYTIKKSGKKAIIKKAVVNTTKKGVQKLVVTVKKKKAGNAKVVITSAANKKAKATVKIKAAKK